MTAKEAREYRIGDFSMLVRLPVKTLHFYHQEGLLKPLRTDPTNGYRWYGAEQVHRAGVISELKEAGFTLGEIREILATCREDGDLASHIQGKLLELEGKRRELDLTRSKLVQLGRRLARPEPEHSGDQTVSSGWQEALAYVSRRFVGEYSQVGRYLSQLYRQCRGQAAGPPFCLYHQLEWRDQDADIEVCLPLKQQVRGLDCRILEAGSWVETLHIGAYADLGRAYKRLFDAATARCLEVQAPARESYLRGPGWFFAGNPGQYRTRVALRCT